MSIFVLLVVVVVLSLAWVSLRKRKAPAAEHFGHVKSFENDPHSDADMQDRYDPKR